MRFTALAAALGILGTVSVAPTGLATTPPAPRIWLPDPHVACDRVQQACFDSCGLSLGYTQIYFGDGAEAALLTSLGQGQAPDSIIQPDSGVSCSLSDQICLDDNGASFGLTGVYFGEPAAERLRDQLTRRVYVPTANVACDLDQSICFDDFGYSLGYTQFYLGQEAADAWLEQINQGKEPTVEFAPLPDALCNLTTKTCMTDQGVSLSLTEKWFGTATAAALTQRIYGVPTLQSICEDALAVKYQLAPSDIALEFARRDEGGNAYGFVLLNGQEGVCRVRDDGTIDYIQEI